MNKTLSAQTSTEKLKEIGGYRLVRELGQGGMATVYLAERIGPGGFSRRVAIKLVHPHLGRRDAFQQQFMREARLGGLLTHPNIVQTLDFGTLEGQPFLAMELVEGLSLEQVLAHHQHQALPLPESILLQLVIQLCRGLQYAHLAHDGTGQPLHLIHRDLKPSNVLLSRHGEVKIADFGIARADLDFELTRESGVIKGTAVYMSPEQAMGRRSIDHRSDLFAVGLILFELYTLLPFHDASSPLVALQRAQSPDVPTRLHRLPPGPLQQPLHQLLSRLLAVNPEERFQQAEQVIRALTPLLETISPAVELGPWAQKLIETLVDEPDTSNISSIEVTAPWLAPPRLPSVPSWEGTAPPPQAGIDDRTGEVVLDRAAQARSAPDQAALDQATPARSAPKDPALIPTIPPVWGHSDIQPEPAAEALPSRRSTREGIETAAPPSTGANPRTASRASALSIPRSHADSSPSTATVDTTPIPQPLSPTADSPVWRKLMPLGLLLLLMSLRWVGAMEPLDTGRQDLYAWYLVPPPSMAQVLVVDLSDEVEPWPWKRSTLAHLLERALLDGGARQVTVDVVLSANSSEPAETRNEGNRRIANVARKTQRLVLAAGGILKPTLGENRHYRLLPGEPLSEEFRDISQGFAALLAPGQRGGPVRRAILYAEPEPVEAAEGVENGVPVAWSLAARSIAGNRPLRLDPVGHRLSLDEHWLLTDPLFGVEIPPVREERLSVLNAVELLKPGPLPDAIAEQVRDKYLVLGRFSDLYLDRVATPWGYRAGVGVQATLLAQLLEGTIRHRWGPELDLMLQGMILSLAFWLMARGKPEKRLSSLLKLLIGAGALEIVALRQRELWLATPVVELLLLTLLVAFSDWRRQAGPPARTAP